MFSVRNLRKIKQLLFKREGLIVLLYSNLHDSLRLLLIFRERLSNSKTILYIPLTSYLSKVKSNFFCSMVCDIFSKPKKCSYDPYQAKWL